MVEVTRIEDLLATAQQVEAGAAKRYFEYAEVASAVNPDAAALFRRLAKEERKHEGSVLDLAREAGIDLSNCSTSTVVSSEKDVNFEPPGGTLYEILREALRREERAFEIYSEIAAQTDDEAVRHFSEILAKEELGHAALIRALRRRVYPEHRQLTGNQNLADPKTISTLQEFLSRAFRLETRLNSLLRMTHANAESLKECMNRSASILRQLSADMVQKREAFQSDQITITTAQVPTQTLQYEFDRAYDYYDRCATRTGNEQIMKYALFLAAKALEQLNTIQVLFRSKTS